MTAVQLNIQDESVAVTSVEAAIASRELDFDRLPNFIPFDVRNEESQPAPEGGDMVTPGRLRRLMAGLEAMSPGYNPHGRGASRSAKPAPRATLSLLSGGSGIADAGQRTPL